MKSLKKTTAWKWFALYIKERDRWICQTCGRAGKGRFMNAGHYIQAFGNNSVFFDEKNVYAQCINCNLWGGGKQPLLKEVVIKRWGKKEEEKLWKKAKEARQFTKEELKKIAEEYKNKYNLLKNE
ncbi:MAG: recombination protein NinG [Patescibacteria group bacterium]|nr:recombination protein NinG [Patescibacteria group bacterium]